MGIDLAIVGTYFNIVLHVIAAMSSSRTILHCSCLPHFARDQTVYVHIAASAAPLVSCHTACNHHTVCVLAGCK